MAHALPPPDPGASAPLDELRSVLVAGEEVVAVALQHRLYALTHRRHIAAATSGRFIFMTRGLFGGYAPVGVRWQDLREVSLSVGVFTATVVVTYSANLSDTAMGEAGDATIVAKGLEREPAAALYRVAQAQEQAWREKRRVRSLEEMRAQAGGVQIATGLYPPQAPAESALAISAEAHGEGPAQRLARAKAMLDQRLITDAEYEQIKARIVGSL
jgi:hypothetical protein